MRVGSRSSKVEDLIEASGLEPTAIFRKGHPRVRGGTRLSRSSGFNVDVSTSDGVLEKQVRDAVRFLKRHAQGLSRLRRCRAFAGMTLDFGLYDKASRDRPWPSYRLPPDLVELAGKHCVELELSFYGTEPSKAD